MRDYWLSRLCFDLQHPGAADEYRANRAQVLDRYPLKADIRATLKRNDVCAIKHYREIPQWYVGAGIASWTM
jgi:hypothetical protein